jgi:hypothetical protein
VGKKEDLGVGESEITLCCRLLKTLAIFRGWVFGNDFRPWLETAA